MLNENIEENENENSIKHIVERIQQGDNMLRNEFIKKYNIFVIRVISSVTNRYIDIKNNDEFSIGLSAFNESINSFEGEKQYDFFKFSEKVIRRRIIDYIRSNKKNNNVYPFTYFEEEDNNDFEEKYLIQEENNDYIEMEIKEEFKLFEENLKEFGISLDMLVLSSPKHKDSKLFSIKIAKIICNYDELYDKLCKSKRIPRADVMKVIDVSERTIERNRKFIIAATLILKSEYILLKEYIENVIKNEK